MYMCIYILYITSTNTPALPQIAHLRSREEIRDILDPQQPSSRQPYTFQSVQQSLLDPTLAPQDLKES